MSVMSFQLGQRRIDPVAASATSFDTVQSTTATTMAEMTRGARAHVTGVCDEADPATARRLFDLGFAPGTEVEMLRKAPMADPVIFRVAGYDIALRRAQARCIQVATLP